MVAASRIQTAIRETEDALKRAERYSPDLRDHKLIAFYRAHIEKLNGMLETGGGDADV